MKKQIFALAALAVMAASSASASANWTIQSEEYTVDTLFHAKIGPGTTQTSLHLTGGSTLKVFYITTDLTNPYVDIRVAQAAKTLTGGATLSTMSNANTNAQTGIQYFAGVNADFFGNSQPIGTSVVNGEVYKINVGWDGFCLNDAKLPAIGRPTFDGTASTTTDSYALSSINGSRATNGLVLFNEHYGSTTGTNAYGTEVVVSADRTVGINGNYTLTVEGSPVANQGSMSIPAGKYVLSGHGTASTFVAGLKDGDKIDLSLTMKMGIDGNIIQMAGGTPIILKDGVTLDTESTLDHLTSLNPRTAVGYNADRTKVVLLVVDGRGRGGSAGVVSKQLADIMRYVGCDDALNFDGGGSSELYTRPFGIRNDPSDGKERAVVNSVWAVSTAPVDNDVAEIAFTDAEIALPKYGYYTPSFFAYNEYGVMLNTDFKDAKLSCDPELGQIVDGNTLFVSGSGVHKLTAEYNGVKASIMVTVGTAEPRSRLDSVIIDSFRDYIAEVVADVNGTDMKIDNKALTWASSEPNVAEVDQLGVIHGLANGSTTITGSVDDMQMKLLVNVQIPASHYYDVDADSDVSAWNITKAGLSSATLTRSGHGFAVDYTISSIRSTQFTIKPKETHYLYALPDSLRLVINPGTGTVAKLTANIAPYGKRTDSYKSTYTVDFKANTDNVLTIPVTDFIDTTDFENYPLTFVSLRFDLGGKVGDVVHFDIPEIQAVYNAVQETESVDDIVVDNIADDTTPLIDNAIAEHGTTLALKTDKPWTVYNVNGAIVLTGKTAYLDTARLAPGVYIIATHNKAQRFVIK